MNEKSIQALKLLRPRIEKLLGRDIENENIVDTLNEVVWLLEKEKVNYGVKLGEKEA